MRYLLVIAILCVTGVGGSAYAQGCPNAPAPRLARDGQMRVIVPGGSNLRLRPSSEAQLLDIIPVDTVLTVRGGPVCGEGYTWWQADYADNRGWVAEGTPDDYWLEPYTPLVAQAGTVAITVPPELAQTAEPRYYPQRVELALEGYPVQHPVFEPTLLAFPEMPNRDDVAAVEAALLQGDRDALTRPVQANFGYVNFNDGSGLRYVTVALDPSTDAVPPTLLYHFRGISNNGHYLSLNAPITAAGLPLDFDPPPSATPDEALADYYAATQEALQTLPPDSYTPSLALLDQTMQSITTSAEPVPLDERTARFEYIDDATGREVIAFRYAPALADEINVAQVRGDADTPPHLRVTLEGYLLFDNDDAIDATPSPERLPTLRLTRTDAIDDDWLVGLELLLSQQPRNPARIPSLYAADRTPVERAKLEYVSFRNGDGLRALLRYDDEDYKGWFVVYQGLADNGQLHVAAWLPVTLPDGVNAFDAPDDALTPPLAWLDALFASLTVSAVP